MRLGFQLSILSFCFVYLEVRDSVRLVSLYMSYICFPFLNVLGISHLNGFKSL